MTSFFQRHLELVRAGLGRGDTGPSDRRRRLADEIAGLTYDDIVRTRAAFGTGAQLVERLAALRDDLGLSGIVSELNPGGLLSIEQMRRTLAILTREVMPAFR